MIILAGLGNPGPQYAHNRHNVGWATVDAIARQWDFSAERYRFSGLAREGRIETGEEAVRILILKPHTFYNESGRSPKRCGSSSWSHPRSSSSMTRSTSRPVASG
jgi:PTH1 family peptidyl-tRNA hydrolase